MVEVSEAPEKKPFSLGILSGSNVGVGRLSSDVAAPNEPQLQPLKCPECGSSKIYNNGKRYLSYGPTVQRFKCRDCNHRFSLGHTALNVNPADKEGSQQKQNPCKDLELLAALENKTSGAGIDTTKQGLIVEFQWKMKKHGLADVTIKNRTLWLNQLVKLGCDLKNPDSVETILATEKIPLPTKLSIVKTYAAFTKAFKIDWEKIKVHYDPKEAFDPLEEEIDLLIGACGKVTAAFLQTLKDTGARCGEIRLLQWTDINEKNGTIAINNPEKGSRTRTVMVTAKTISMLKNLRKKNGDYIFNPNSVSVRDAFSKVRKRLAERMQNPRLLKIHFHTLRHWRASREYEKTGDIYQVKDLLGHRSVMSTDRYQHGIFKSDEYISKRPKTSLEEDALISAGFEYVRFDDRANEPIYRKRK